MLLMPIYQFRQNKEQLVLTEGKNKLQEQKHRVKLYEFCEGANAKVNLAGKLNLESVLANEQHILAVILRQICMSTCWLRFKRLAFSHLA